MLKPSECEGAPSKIKETQCKEVELWIDTELKAKRFQMTIPRSGWTPAALERTLSGYRKLGWVIQQVGSSLNFQAP